MSDRLARVSYLAASFIALSLAAPPARAQMSADEQLRQMQPEGDFDVSLFASEPMITNPAAIDIDTHGRVWVAEIEWYRRMAKQPPADKIKVLEDTDGDGKADKVTVFAEGVFCPMSICVAGDKVYVATSPDLWVYEDKNGDLKADGPPKKLLSGFGGVNHDHGAHSVVLGPDHKWWMSHGDAGFDVKGTDGSHIKYQWGAMLRGELDGSKLETVAVNFRNPYEICVSSFGEAYCSDNDNDGNRSVRICWIMDGGDYGWFGRPPEHAPPGTPFGEHWHFRGHIPGFVPATLCTGFGSPCGICFYEGNAFGEEFKNAPLHAEAGPGEVRRYPHENAGFGKKGANEVFLKCKDRYFRPDDICVAPDGSLLVSDWYDGGVGGHAYNNPNQGRIFLLKPKNAKLARLETPGPYKTVAEAIVGLKSPNLATQYLARERLLTDGNENMPALVELLKDSEPNYRARALWVLDRIGGSGRNEVVKQLKSSDPAFRALAVRILRRHGDEFADKILPLASDKSDEVVREVLLATRTIKSPAADAALAAIARRYDGTDRYLLEAINVAAGDRKLALHKQVAANGGFSAEQSDLLQLLNPAAGGESLRKQLLSSTDATKAEALIRSASAGNAPEFGKILIEYLAKDGVSDKLRTQALDGLAANLKGPWKSLIDDKQLAGSLQKLLDIESQQKTVLKLVGEQGLKQLDQKVIELARSKKARPEIRRAAIEAAIQLNSPQIDEQLRSLLEDDSFPVRQAALYGLIDRQDWKTVRDVLSADSKLFSDKPRNAAVDRLFNSTGGALLLLKLIEDKQIAESLKDRVISKAVSHPDANVRIAFEQFIPADQRPKKLGETITAAQILALKGEASRGEQIFMHSTAAQCKSCHRVRGNGGKVGPDLTLIGKKYEQATLLETIMEPSKAIAPEYVSYIATLPDGRRFAGFIADRDERQIALRDAQNKIIRVPADETELTPQSKSMMPELVLRDVTAQDAADLLAYLMTLK
jgi:putative membrane-bound dehydrogenase-like protein